MQPIMTSYVGNAFHLRLIPNHLLDSNLKHYFLKETHPDCLLSIQSQALASFSGTFVMPFYFSVCVCVVAKSCPTLCDPRDCSLPGSPIHRILQARILEWVAISSLALLNFSLPLLLPKKSLWNQPIRFSLLPWDSHLPQGRDLAALSHCCILKAEPGPGTGSNPANICWINK